MCSCRKRRSENCVVINRLIHFIVISFLGDKFFYLNKKNVQVLLEIDIYSIVGANKPLQVVDVRVSVGMDEVLLIRFDGVCGSPIVNGICIKNATNVPGIGSFMFYHI